ncbi:MAG: alkane 1-monooxygenase [Pirellula sp.]
MKPWNYLASFSIPVFAAIGLLWGGIWAWLTVVAVFVGVPALDALVGCDKRAIGTTNSEQLRGASRFYSWILYLHLPVQLGLILLCGWEWSRQSVPAWVLAGWVLSVALSTGGIGITVAHELVHRKTKTERWIGRLILMTVLYMHFAIEHVRGHHKNVGTREDAATAARGTNVYAFILYTIPAQWLSAWRLELQRLKKLGFPIWSWRNEMVSFLVIQALWLAALGALFGWGFLGVYFVIAVLSFGLLEVVNYIEHYGLERHTLPSGRLETVQEHHSWNSDHRVSRMLLFELSRHSDHHMAADRQYQTLRSKEHSPQLPSGYPGMVLLALCPPVWFWLMNPRLVLATEDAATPV